MTAPCLPGLFDQGERVTPEKPLHPVAAEKVRLHAAAMRVLERLRIGPAMNYELATPEIGGLRAVGRVHELKQAGHRIEKAHVDGGTWRYTLIE